MSLHPSRRSRRIVQSEIRAMTRECKRLDGINMAQGVCDLPVPEAVMAGAEAAIRAGINTYTAAEGLDELRRAIADRYRRDHALDIDAGHEVLVSAGATGAFYATAQALLDPGDEVILFEPFYGYHASTLKALDCPARHVHLQAPDWTLDRAALEAAITPATRAIVLSNPSNPSGKVLSLSDLELLADFVERHDLVLFCDEIYEHFVYDGRRHLPPATLPRLRKRTVTIGGFSKIFSVTGWRLGYALCPPEIFEAAAGFNDLIYVCDPAPLQVGATRGLLELEPAFYRQVAAEHQSKRDRFCAALDAAGLTPSMPEGAYYVMADISAVPGADDREKVMWILHQTGVSAVPGRAFYHDDGGRDLARFCFAKRPEVLEVACEKIRALGLKT